MPPTLGVFAKHWTPGKSKTRLAATIGDEQAAAVARLLLVATLRRADGLARQAGAEPLLAYAHAGRAAFKALVDESVPDAAAWSLIEQPDGDLGQRIEWFFRERRGGAAVLLGADCPHAPSAAIRDALQRVLQPQCRLVLGPADDGGYWLIGARGEPPPVFERMPWSEPTLVAATVERVRALGWSLGREYDLVETARDIDSIDDLAWLRTRIAGAVDPPLVELRRGLDGLLGTGR